VETLRQGPRPNQAGILTGRWHLASIRAAVPRLQKYSLSGIWRILRRHRLKMRTASVQQYSPDPDYEPKLEHLLSCLREASQQPSQTVLLFLDEMGYYCWPWRCPRSRCHIRQPAPAPPRRRDRQPLGRVARCYHRRSIGWSGRS
jgi:hypothetical protein